MKIFAYIFSFLVLALSVNPCIDKPKDNSLQKSEISQTSNHENHENEADHCSPFCTCHCCQTSFCITKNISNLSFVELEISYNDYSQSFQSLELFDFYIPPKS